MAQPSKTAYAEAAAIVAAGDKLMITEAAEVFPKFIEDMDAAVAGLQAARSRYPASTPSSSMIDNWIAQIQSFRNTALHLQTAADSEKARLHPPEADAPAS